MRGAVVGGYLFLLIATCCAALFGFGMTFLNHRRVLANHKRQIQDLRMMMLNENESRNSRSSRKFKQEIPSPPSFPLQEIIQRARFPLVIGSATSIQLANWTASAFTLLVNPFFDSNKISVFKEKVLLGALPIVVFWFLLWLGFCVYLWNRSLSRKFLDAEKKSRTKSK